MIPNTGYSIAKHMFTWYSCQNQQITESNVTSQKRTAISSRKISYQFDVSVSANGDGASDLQVSVAALAVYWIVQLVTA